MPSHELFNSCQLLLDGAATRDDRAFIVLSAMLAAGGEGTLEEMALQRLTEGEEMGPKIDESSDSNHQFGSCKLSMLRFMAAPCFFKL